MVKVQSVFEAAIETSLYSSGLDAAMRRRPRLRFVESIGLSMASSILINSDFLRRQETPVRSFAFASPAEVPDLGNGKEVSGRLANRESSALTKTPSDRRTRVRPPRDVVKFSDRLFFLLQPSLQTFLDQESLTLPFPPFSFQWDGIAFLYPRMAAILADEMGLGKTMQSITAMRMLFRTGELGRVLLVCPKPLVTNWEREFSVWAPELPLAVVEGPQTRRHWHWSHVTAPIKIANYEAVLRDAEHLTAEGIQFDLVLLDEAQRIKNRRSATSEACRSILRRRSWALTGTPVENSSEDLLGIFEFLSPGYLSPEMPVKGMGRAAGDYILRRTKSLVLKDLPPKLIRDARLELSPDQRQAYDLAQSNGIIRLSNLGNKITIQHVLELVLRLKQICNFDPLTRSSAKLDQLRADCEEIAASGQKALVFSQWVDALQKIRPDLESYGVLEFHGRIPPRKRDAILEQFRTDESKHVLLMTYGAGSVGLNLQFAGYVFLFDRWWNPAVEDQAINRAHRIGATGPVTVTRFISVETIEERIHDILERKRELFEMILSHANQDSRLGLSQQELFGLFQLDVPANAAA